MKHLFYILSLIFILSSCHSSKKIYPSDPIYDNSNNYDDHADTSNNHADISKNRKAIVKEAKKWIGTPYVYAGESKKGTDCSGMVMTIYRDITGIKIPRNSLKQAGFCKKIDKADLLPGDLIFFATGKNKKRISHVGIYIGKGNMVHASTSRGVTINNITETYYSKTYICSGRILSDKKNYKKEKHKKKDDNNEDNNLDDFSIQFLE